MSDKIKVVDIDTPNNDGGFVLFHFIATFDEPGRIEVSNDRGGNLIAHAYTGTEIDMEQEPVAVYDSTIIERGSIIAGGE